MRKRLPIFRWVAVVAIATVVWKSLAKERISIAEGFATPAIHNRHSHSYSHYRPVISNRLKSIRLASESSIVAESESITNGDLDNELDNKSNNAQILAQERNNIHGNNNDDEEEDIEGRVIESIQSVASAAGNLTENPQEFFSALGAFGKSSGALITQQWLTPESLEECTVFWDDGFRILMRDLFRSYIFSNKSTRYRLKDWVALGWFLLVISSSSIIFFPLLQPLIKVGLEKVSDIDEGTYIPPSFGSKRLAAMRRLRSPSEAPLEQYTANAPKNIREGLSFFQDGTLLLARDFRRGELTSNDSWGTYGWFAFLVFSSFPLTPLILPLIDKRRPESDPSDYLPSSYRQERLKVVSRLRSLQTIRYGTTPRDTLRAASDPIHKPPPEMLLEAIVKAQNEPGRRQNNSPLFLEALAGVPGRRWELAYVAGKPAVVAMRKKLGNSAKDNNNNDWVRPLERFWLPWTRLRDGLYINSGYVSAIQNFDRSTMQNVNGVFQILGSDFFRTTVAGPFSWDGERQSLLDSSSSSNSKESSSSSACICAFRPNKATFRLGPWWEIEQDIPEETPFDETHIRDLPFFKFIHVDDKVAVAMGRSGSVALWKRMDDGEEASKTN